MIAWLRTRAVPPLPRRPKSLLRGRGNSPSTIGGALPRVPLQFFVPAVTLTSETPGLTIGPVIFTFTVLDGSGSSLPPDPSGGGGGGETPPPPVFTVTSGVVMELTFLELVPRYAVEIIDVTDGLVDP